MASCSTSINETKTTNHDDCDQTERIKLMKTRRFSVVSCDGDIQFTGCRIAINDGNYEYVNSHEALLGLGSYGAVFRGIDKRLHRKQSVYNNTAVRSSRNDTRNPASDENPNVATSLKPREVAIKKIARTSLKPNELRAMTRVRHPNLVRLIDICNAEDNEKDEDNLLYTYLIMELCDTDLDRHLRKYTTENHLPLSELRRVIECISCGYLALYEKRIVHRDIKPQNILLNYTRSIGDLQMMIANAKITDFGISRIYEAIEDDDFCDYDSLNNVAGTFYYMAPEVGANLLRLSEYDYSVDVWSIGCVIYQCLTGRIPFDEGSMCKLFLYCAGSNYDAYDLPDLPTDTSLVSSQINALITHLLQIDRDKRASPQQLYGYVTTWQSMGPTEDESCVAENVTATNSAQQQLQSNISFASLSSVLSSTSTLENSNSTTMISSSEGEEMFTNKAANYKHL